MLCPYSQWKIKILRQTSMWVVVYLRMSCWVAGTRELPGHGSVISRYKTVHWVGNGFGASWSLCLMGLLPRGHMKLLCNHISHLREEMTRRFSLSLWATVHPQGHDFPGICSVNTRGLILVKKKKKKKKKKKDIWSVFHPASWHRGPQILGISWVMEWYERVFLLLLLMFIFSFFCFVFCSKEAVLGGAPIASGWGGWMLEESSCDKRVGNFSPNSQPLGEERNWRLG